MNFMVLCFHLYFLFYNLCFGLIRDHVGIFVLVGENIFFNILQKFVKIGHFYLFFFCLCHFVMPLSQHFFCRRFDSLVEK